jgi:hypothetical protein
MDGDPAAVVTLAENDQQGVERLIGHGSDSGQLSRRPKQLSLPVPTVDGCLRACSPSKLDAAHSPQVHLNCGKSHSHGRVRRWLPNPQAIARTASASDVLLTL